MFMLVYIIVWECVRIDSLLEYMFFCWWFLNLFKSCIDFNFGVFVMEFINSIEFD